MGGKEHPTPHHSIEWHLILRRSLATSVKGLSTTWPYYTRTNGVAIITTLNYKYARIHF